MSTASSSGLRLRRLLVAAEMGLAIILLTGAGLLVRSFWRMTAHPPGFDPARTLSVELLLTGPRYQALPQQRAYYQDLLGRIQGLPGVEAAGVIFTPLYGLIYREGGRAQPSARPRFGSYTIVSSDFRRILGVRLVKGRWFTDHETARAVMINESYARAVFGSINPIGQRIMVPMLVPGPQNSAATVVGVASDLKYTRLDTEPNPEVYLPYLRSTLLLGSSLMVRTAGDASRLAPAIRTQIAELDATRAPGEMRTLEESLAETIAPRRFNLLLLGTFAGSAVLLALIGIYGVIAYAVAQRTHEIGVRMALGAQRGQVVRQVVREGMSLAAAGILAGLAAALGLTRLMTSLLYDVKPNDPATFAVVALALAATALAACWKPAIRAARVDPASALREE